MQPRASHGTKSIINRFSLLVVLLLLSIAYLIRQSARPCPPSGDPATKTSPSTIKKIVLFGDSLTQYGFSPQSGWGTFIAHVYQRRADVINRGLSGYNTRMALHMFDRAMAGVLDETVAICTIFFGANDALLLESQKGVRPNQHIPLDEFRANLATIVDRIKAGAPNAKIVMMTPPPVSEPGRVAFIKKKFPKEQNPVTDRLNSVTKQYAEAVVAVAKEKGAELVDMFEGMISNPKYGSVYFYDGLHFSAMGQEKVADLVMAAIKKALPIDNVPLSVPWWGDIIEDTVPKEEAAARAAKATAAAAQAALRLRSNAAGAAGAVAAADGGTAGLLPQ